MSHKDLENRDKWDARLIKTQKEQIDNLEQHKKILEEKIKILELESKLHKEELKKYRAISIEKVEGILKENISLKQDVKSLTDLIGGNKGKN